MGLSTHILDIAQGRPAIGVAIELAKLYRGDWQEVGSGITDIDGRCKTLLGGAELEEATYRLRFATAGYYETQYLSGLYPFVDIVFSVAYPTQHYHIPLLLTANGYSTYRGS